MSNTHSELFEWVVNSNEARCAKTAPFAIYWGTPFDTTREYSVHLNEIVVSVLIILIIHTYKSNVNCSEAIEMRFAHKM